VDEGRPNGDTTAEHRRCLCRAYTIGNLDSEVCRSSAVVSISTKGLRSVWIFSVVCPNIAFTAVLLLTIGAILTVQAGTGLRANTDTIANFEVLHILSNFHCGPDNFMAYTARV
jgi:hypothetical protein